MRAMIDSLEGRQLFAFSVVDTVYQPGPFTGIFVGGSNATVTTFKVSKTGTLFVSGSAKADTLNIQVKNGKLAGISGLSIARTDLKTGEVVTTNVGSARIRRIDLSGLGGNDTITVIADVPVNVRGAAGDDTLNVFAPSRTISGGSGTNTIREGNELAGDAYKQNAIRLAENGQFAPLTVKFTDGKFAITSAIKASELTEPEKKPTRTSPRGG